jgi:hypothetical protein
MSLVIATMIWVAGTVTVSPHPPSKKASASTHA